MRVSISKAAEMVGVTRATLYRHIDKKGITVQKDEDGNPKIDVSELIRVYGDRVQTPANDTPHTEAFETTETPLSQPDHAVSLQSEPSSMEIEILRERLRNYETERNRTDAERDRERHQLLEQIQQLRINLEQSQEQQKRLTLLITDQRPKTAPSATPPPAAPQSTYSRPEPAMAPPTDASQTHQEPESGEANAPQEPPHQMEIMEKTIQKLQNQNKRIYYELQKQKEQTIFQKLFGTKAV